MYHNACMFFVCSRSRTVNKDLESESGGRAGRRPRGVWGNAPVHPRPGPSLVRFSQTRART